MILGDSTADTTRSGVLGYPDRMSLPGQQVLLGARTGTVAASYDPSIQAFDYNLDSRLSSQSWYHFALPILENNNVVKAHIVTGINDSITWQTLKASYGDQIGGIAAALATRGIPLYVGISNKVDASEADRLRMSTYADWTRDDMLTECPNCCVGADFSGIDCAVSGCNDSVHPDDTSQATMTPLVEAALAAEVCD